MEKILNIVGHRDKDDVHSEIYFIQVILNIFSRTQSNNCTIAKVIRSQVRKITFTFLTHLILLVKKKADMS
jgi:hypothetical protein